MRNPIARVLRRMAGATPPLPATLAPAGGARPALLEVDKWAASRYVRMLAAIVDYHPFPADELLLMTAAFHYHRPDVVIDVGTHLGKSARIWHELGKALGIPARVHTIDLCDPAHPECPGSRLGEMFRGLPVTQHIGDGCAVAAELIAENAGAAILLFLDGDHRYETVLRELALIPANARGCALVHDTFYQPGSHYNHGPYLAVEEFLRGRPVKQVFHTQMGLPGMSYLGLD